MKKVDMSPAAIDRRLLRVSQLRRLGLELARAKDLGPVDPEAAARWEERTRKEAAAGLVAARPHQDRGR